MKTIATIIILLIALNLSAKNYAIFGTTHSLSTTTCTFYSGGIINNTGVGLIGENTLINNDIEYGKGCLYAWAGKLIKDKILISPLLGYGRSHYNNSLFQYGIKTILRIRFIHVGMMYNTTSRYSIIGGIIINVK